MKPSSAKKIVSFAILAAGFCIGAWAASLTGAGAAMLLATVLVALPFVMLALIARFMASCWFSLALVLLAAAGAAWFSIETYPDSRNDAQGALIFVFLPILSCSGAGIVAVLVVLSEIIARARFRLASARTEADATKTARQVSVARWSIAGSALLFVVIAGVCLHKITQEVLRHHEVNAARNLRSQEDRLRTLEVALSAKDHEILGILAHQDLPSEELRRIHEFILQNRNAGSTVSHNLASNPKTPPDLLTTFAASGQQLERSVAQNPSAPAAVLEKLAAHEDKYVRQAVAQNPSSPESLLAVLAKDGDDMVRGAAAHFLKKLKNQGKAGKKKAASKKPQP